MSSLRYRVKGSLQHLEAVKKLCGCGPIEDDKVCGIWQVEGSVMEPVGVGKVKFGGAEEVGFALV